MDKEIEKEAENLYEESINATLPKEIPFTLKEREFLLVGILLTKAEKQFFAEYEKMSKVATETENTTEEFKTTYEFLRDSSLILEALVERMNKIQEEHGTKKYDFSKFGALIEKLNDSKGGQA